VTDVPELLGVPPEELESWAPRDPRRYRRGTRLRYSGPIYAKLAVPVPERVEQFLADSDTVVYVAITSSTAQLVRDVVAALRALDVPLLVAATRHDLRDLEDERVLVEGVLPSHEIMPRVDLAVISGGQGSVQTALASGLPLIGVPLQPEQDANVALVERQGAARLVPQPLAGTRALADIARTMLGDPGYRRQALRLQAIFARADGPGASADAIIELLDSTPGPTGASARGWPGTVSRRG
jgi:UDP:flavonoid glycosyltransferase YjiC (YdhE family)